MYYTYEYSLYTKKYNKSNKLSLTKKVFHLLNDTKDCNIPTIKIHLINA